MPDASTLLLGERSRVTFSESIQTCLTKYADFNGRATRGEFWWFVLFATLASLAARTVGQNLDLLVSLGLLLPQLGAGVRRLHDTGKSGAAWFIVLIPLVGVILLIVWWATEGDPGDNAYGPSPA